MRKHFSFCLFLLTILAALSGDVLHQVHFAQRLAHDVDPKDQRLQPVPPAQQVRRVSFQLEVDANELPEALRDDPIRLLAYSDANLFIGPKDFKLKSEEDSKTFRTFPRVYILPYTRTLTTDFIGPLPPELGVYSEDARLLGVIKGSVSAEGFAGDTLKVKLTDILPPWMYLVYGRMSDAAGGFGDSIAWPTIGLVHPKMGSLWAEAGEVQTFDLGEGYFAVGLNLQGEQYGYDSAHATFHTDKTDIREISKYYSKTVTPKIEWRVRTPYAGLMSDKVRPKREKGNIVELPTVVAKALALTTINVQLEKPRYRIATPREEKSRERSQSAFQNQDPMDDDRQQNANCGTSQVNPVEDRYLLSSGSVHLRILIQGAQRYASVSARFEHVSATFEPTQIMLPAGRVQIDGRFEFSTNVEQVWGNCQARSGNISFDLPEVTRRKRKGSENLMLTLRTPNVFALQPMIAGNPSRSGDLMGVHIYGDANARWPGLWTDAPEKESIWNDHGDPFGREQFPCLVWWFGENARMVFSGFEENDPNEERRYWTIETVTASQRTLKPVLGKVLHQVLQVVVPPKSAFPSWATGPAFRVAYGGIQVGVDVVPGDDSQTLSLKIWNDAIGRRPSQVALYQGEAGHSWQTSKMDRISEYTPVPFDRNGAPIELKLFKEEDHPVPPMSRRQTYHTLRVGPLSIISHTGILLDNAKAPHRTSWSGGNRSLYKSFQSSPWGMYWGGKETPLKWEREESDSTVMLSVLEEPALANVSLSQNLAIYDYLRCEWDEHGEVCQTTVRIRDSGATTWIPMGVPIRFFMIDNNAQRAHLVEEKLDLWEGEAIELKSLAKEATLEFVKLKEAKELLIENGITMRVMKADNGIESDMAKEWYPIGAQEPISQADRDTPGIVNTKAQMSYRRYLLEIGVGYGMRDWQWVDSPLGETTKCDMESQLKAMLEPKFLTTSGKNGGQPLVGEMCWGLPDKKEYSNAYRSSNPIGRVRRDAKKWEFSCLPQVASAPQRAVTLWLSPTERGDEHEMCIRLRAADVEEVGAILENDPVPQQIPDLRFFHQALKPIFFSEEENTVAVHAWSADKTALDVILIGPSGNEMMRFPHSRFLWNPIAGRMLPDNELLEDLKRMGLEQRLQDRVW